MTSEPWQVIGSIASTAGITTCVIGGAKGVVEYYRTYASPHTCLTESEKRMERARSRLQGLSPKRREEIEIAMRSGSSNCQSLRTLEDQLQDLTDMHCRLSTRIEESTFTERHFPYSEFRNRLSTFEDLAKELLTDTMKTTVPYVDDIAFVPESSRRATKRPSSSESTSSPESSRRATESSSSIKSMPNPEESRLATKGSSSSVSTGYDIHESFSEDVGAIPLSRMV